MRKSEEISESQSYKINKDAEKLYCVFLSAGCFCAMLTDYFGNKIAEKKIEIFDSKSSFKRVFWRSCQAIDEFLRPRIGRSAQLDWVFLVCQQAGVVSEIPSFHPGMGLS